MDSRVIFNVLAVTGTGAFAGVMLAIGMILGAYWKSLPPENFVSWFAQNGNFVGRTIPFVLLPSLIGLAGSLWLGWGDAWQRTAWLVAFGAIVLVLLITVVFHLPANASFAARSIAISEVPAKLDQWLALHWVRIGLGFLATLAGTLAVVK